MNSKNEKEYKQYFLKDEALKSLDDDRFHHQDIARNLRYIIENNKAPFNIAIIGKWGLGKSSLINMVIEPFKNTPDEYIVHEINAWKYEKETLCRVFLKQLWQKVNGDQKVKTFDIVKREVSEIFDFDEPKPDLRPIYINTLKVFGTIFLLSVLALLVYKLVQGFMFGFVQTTVLAFLGALFLSYCKNIATVLVLPITVAGLKILLDQINEKQTKKIELNFPLETADDYEIMLEKQIQERLANNPNLKVVTVIDDLDRLSLPKIVEALDAIKTFINLDRCIFIVPFDDSILKSALEKARLNNLLKDTNLLESELVLDKLFQYKIYLPPLLDYDIKKYSVDLCLKNMPHFVNEYCSDKEFEKVLRHILIHNAVKTPRQVKKLVNIFASNIMIATDREKAGTLGKGFVSNLEGKCMIAIITVLQADYNEFYDVLFKNSSYIDTLINCYKHSEKTDLPDDLKYFFNINEEGYKIRTEFIPLVQFLIKTQKYILPNILSYLYVAQDEVSVLTGDEMQQAFVAAVSSGDLENAQTKLIDSPDLAKIIEQTITHTDDNEDTLLAFVLGSIVLFNSFGETYKSIIISAISERMPDIINNSDVFDFEKVDFDNLFEIISLDGSKQVSRLLGAFWSLQESKRDIDTILRALPIFFNNMSSLSLEITTQIKSYISKSLATQEISVEQYSAVTSCVSDDNFIKYFGTQYFTYICDTLVSENSFSDEIAAELISSAKKLLNSKLDINILAEASVELFAYPTLFDALNTIFTDAYTSKINIENGTKIADKLIGVTKKEGLPTVYRILTDIKYNVSQTSASTYDSYFAAITENSVFSSLIINYSRNNKLDLIPLSIEKLNVTVFKEQSCIEAFSEIESNYTNLQRNEIFSHLSTNTVYVARKVYSLEKQIIAILSKNKDNHSHLESWYTATLLSQFSSYYTAANYILFAIESTNATIDFLTENSKTNAISYFNSAIPYAPNEIIAFYFKNSDKITDTDFATIVQPLLNNVTELSFNDAYNLFNRKEKWFKRDDNALSHYSELLIGKFELSGTPDIVLGKIHSFYSNLDDSRIKQLAAKIIASNNEPNNALVIKVFVKFIDAIDDTDTVVNTIISLATIKFKWLSTVLSQLSTYTPAIVISFVSENVIDYSATHLNILLSVLVETTPKVVSGEINNMLEQILKEHDNSSVIEELVNIIKVYPKKLSIKDTRQIEMFYRCFNSTTSDIIKKAILEGVQTLGVIKQFKAKCTDEETQFINNNLSM